MGVEAPKPTTGKKAQIHGLVLDVNLPLNGPVRSMYFNRLLVQQDAGFTLVHFGLFSSGGVLDSFRCVFTPDALTQNKTSLLEYLGKATPVKSPPPDWPGTSMAQDRATPVVDIIQMTRHGEVAETNFYSFSKVVAQQVLSSATKPVVQAEAIISLRSSSDLQSSLIEELYK
jgi:hypothetical protein